MDERGKMLWALKECIQSINHCRRTLDVIVKNKESPSIVVQSALDTEAYLQITLHTLKELGLT